MIDQREDDAPAQLRHLADVGEALERRHGRAFGLSSAGCLGRVLRAVAATTTLPPAFSIFSRGARGERVRRDRELLRELAVAEDLDRERRGPARRRASRRALLVDGRAGVEALEIADVDARRSRPGTACGSRASAGGAESASGRPGSAACRSCRRGGPSGPSCPPQVLPRPLPMPRPRRFSFLLRARGRARGGRAWCS